MSVKERCWVNYMVREDLPQVLEIESASFENAWNEDEFLRCLRQRNCIGLVARLNDQVVGYVIFELHKNRLHLLNIAVDPRCLRSGIGTELIAALVGRLSAERRNRIMLEVREANLPAQLFFKSQGFRAISVLSGFYDDTDEDAYLMQYRYIPSLEEVSERQWPK